MPIVDNNGVPIYYETEGNGPPLVLLHGSFCSLENWGDYGYVEVLRKTHRLILLDSRGHGRSGKLHDSASYNLASRVSDVVAVMDDLNIETAHFMGYSMGGWIGFGLAQYVPQRFRSMILGGAHPFAENMSRFRTMLPREAGAFLALLEPAFGVHLIPALRERMLTNDLDALASLTTDRDDFSKVLPTMRMPCLLLVGGADPRLEQVRQCAKLMPNVTLVTQPDCGHVPTFARSDLSLPHIASFLARHS